VVFPIHKREVRKRLEMLEPWADNGGVGTDHIRAFGWSRFKGARDMDTEQVHPAADSLNNDDAMDDTLWGMFRGFYNRSMLSIIIVVWVYGLIFLAVAVYCGIRFFKTDDTQYQIMYAVIFLCSIQFLAIMKIFAWQMIHRNSIKKAIKRLETRLEQR
jgi:hypothetical protein